MNASRGRGRKRGADPLFSILNAVFKMSKKCIFPRRRGKRGSPACQKIAPRGIGGGGWAVTECGGRCWPGRPRRKKGGRRKRKKWAAGFSRFSRFSRFSGRRGPETEIGGRGERGAGRGGEKKRGAARRKKIPPGRREKMPPRRKNGAGRGRPRQPIDSPPHRLIGRTASGLCPTRTV